MKSAKKSAKEEKEVRQWHETFNRQWELMKSIKEWMDVYIWEIDKDTIMFANKKARIQLLMASMIFDDHMKEITKSLSKNGRDIKVGDILSWISNKFSVNI
jgi:hypothetical protein